GDPFERGKGRNSPALVVVAVFRRGSDGEGRHLVEKEVEAVVVVEDDGDVRLFPFQPLTRRAETVEERLPVGVLLELFGDGAADRRNVRRSEAADDLGHGDLLRHIVSGCLFWATRRALNASFVMPVWAAPRSCTSRPRMPANLAR